MDKKAVCELSGNDAGTYAVSVFHDVGVPDENVISPSVFCIASGIGGLAGVVLLGISFAINTGPPTSATMTTQKFEFVSNGNRLSGFADLPVGGAARAMIVIIHGYGKTDVAGRTSYYDLRSRFTQLGISTLIWDKPGCGKSKGTFDADQPVESSPAEVLDAVRQARESSCPARKRPDLGASAAAGWIAPLAITQDPKIAFWISVSGTDNKENFPYLLESNLRIEGRTEEQIKLLVGGWSSALRSRAEAGPMGLPRGDAKPSARSFHGVPVRRQ